MVVHPDTSLEIALLADDLLGRNIENISVQFVLFLLADVQDVVFADFVRGQHEREAVLDVVKSSSVIMMRCSVVCGAKTTFLNLRPLSSKVTSNTYW